MSRGLNIFQRQKLKRLVYFWSILDLFWRCLPPNFCKILLISPEPFITEYHKDEKKRIRKNKHGQPIFSHQIYSVKISS